MVNSHKLHLIFPKNYTNLCQSITDFVKADLGILCEATNYDLLNLNIYNIYHISEILDKTNILILAYCDEMPSESFYKLGIAFEKKKSIILINIINSNIKENSKIPSYVQKDFLLTFSKTEDIDKTKETLKKLCSELEEKIKILLNPNLNINRLEYFYHLTLDWCKNLENITDSNIETVDFKGFAEEFGRRLTNFKNEKGLQSLKELLINKSDELYVLLLNCIAHDKHLMCAVLMLAKEKLQKNKKDGDAKTINQYNTYYQHGKGDNFAGDHTDGDKIIK